MQIWQIKLQIDKVNRQNSTKKISKKSQKHTSSTNKTPNSLVHHYRKQMRKTDAQTRNVNNYCP